MPLLQCIPLAKTAIKCSLAPNSHLSFFDKASAHLATLVSVAVLTFAPAAFADDAARGLEIATEVKNRDRGWVDTSADMEMILRSPDGRESVRQIRVKTLEVDDDGDKSLTIFDAPRDVEGTAFLSFSHIEGPDDQWIYLPAVKRVKRIATRNKSGPFMGSEFAFEDMVSFEVEKFTFKYLRDEQLDGRDMYVVEQVPVDEFSGYSKQIVWVDKEHYRLEQTEFYDRKGALLKVLSLDDYQQYEGQYWRALRADMDNMQTGKSTTLLTSDLRFKEGLDTKDFDKNALRRAK
ncbi:outer membrane lipoprotein-sorting protein [Ningiella sp. W23]|uniref:outer membrane lipoprotein-sorting protein n=1 Tax=Ningiella sp. W23 TaxID=3023715 RepID=UPI0037575DC5